MTTFELGLLGLLAHSNTNPVLMGISISKSQYRLDVFRVNHRLLSIASLQDIFTSSSARLAESIAQHTLVFSNHKRILFPFLDRGSVFNILVGLYMTDSSSPNKAIRSRTSAGLYRRLWQSRCYCLRESFPLLSRQSDKREGSLWHV